jgi:hypothetical protein
MTERILTLFWLCVLIGAVYGLAVLYNSTWPDDPCRTERTRMEMVYDQDPPVFRHYEECARH